MLMIRKRRLPRRVGFGHAGAVAAAAAVARVSAATLDRVVVAGWEPAAAVSLGRRVPAVVPLMRH
jgi:hypothetical protein